MSVNRKTPAPAIASVPHLKEFRQLSVKARQLQRAVDRFDRDTERQQAAIRRARSAERDALAAPLKLVKDTRQATYELEFERLVNGDHVLTLTQAEGNNPFTRTWLGYCSCDVSVWGKSPATIYKHHHGHVSGIVRETLDALTPSDE